MREGTLIVTAPVNTSSAAPTNFGTFSPGRASGVAPAQAIAMMEANLRTGASASELAKTCADQSIHDKLDAIIFNFKNAVFFDNCLTGNGHYMSDFITDAKLRKTWQISDMNDQLSGGPWSVFAALSNFLWGNGRAMNIDINNIGLSLSPGNILGFQDHIASMSAPGVYNTSYKFSYSTSNDSIVAAYYLGNITLNIEGLFNRAQDGTWNFQGHVKGFQDTYDFNRSNHRTSLGENLTTVGRYLQRVAPNAKEYPININGSLPVNLSGQ